ncbi:MAG: exodeoxyribonuclease VII small subunit [Clostridia bacterium]|nr:exodeoxyribonuclease VII small subunit [Clostridia bacterium]
MNNTEKMTFEEAVARLEQIVRAMEEGKLSLDDSLKAFEEGIALVRFCNGRLDSAEQRVRVLMSGEDGALTEQPFRPTGA